MKYKCMICGKIYEENNLPTIEKGDGCCTVGSLIEVEYIDMYNERMEEMSKELKSKPRTNGLY